MFLDTSNLLKYESRILSLKDIPCKVWIDFRSVFKFYFQPIRNNHPALSVPSPPPRRDLATQDEAVRCLEQTKTELSQQLSNRDHELEETRQRLTRQMKEQSRETTARARASIKEANDRAVATERSMHAARVAHQQLVRRPLSFFIEVADFWTICIFHAKYFLKLFNN